MVQMDVVSTSIKETKNLAKDFLDDIKKKGESVVLLSGDLGVGKTAFSKCIGELLGIDPNKITSPTFLLRRDYETKNSFFKKMVHIDLYRMEDKSELSAIDWDGVCAMEDTLILVEWPELVRSKCRDGRVVDIVLDGDKRIFKI